MSDVVIRAEGLGKRYLIGHRARSGERYTALRDVVGKAVKSAARSAYDMVRGAPIVIGDEVEEFWALKDVAFEISRGEVVGIIGRNGAGKSTLLKILSRITEPTTGRVSICGRVASLLEVGTGFHPELTGRENIYLNGAILGMSRAEIKRKFDEIVAFAEVEKFLDTPVKRYSSGMYVRLAFAVAAHLEPEILVVDEVLAVGDAEFQKKCLGKMQDVAGDGRTVLFVSHNMAAIENLTSKSLLLEGGGVVASAATSDVVSLYLDRLRVSHSNTSIQFGDAQIRMEVLAADGEHQTAFRCGSEIAFRIYCLAPTPIMGLELRIPIFTAAGFRITTLSSRHQSTEVLSADGRAIFLAHWRNNCLAPGKYNVWLALYQDGQYKAHWENVIELHVIEADYYSTGRMPDGGMGPLLPDCRWQSPRSHSMSQCVSHE